MPNRSLDCARDCETCWHRRPTCVYPARCNRTKRREGLSAMMVRALRIASHRLPWQSVAVMCALFVLSACGAVYPRYTTLLRDAPRGLIENGELTQPPDTVHRLSAVRAELPGATRDGRNWDNGNGPDPYVVVLRNGEEIFRSRVIQDTQRPVWDVSRD